MLYRGGCHCGAIAFEVEAPEDIVAQECNCSICRMVGYLHLIVPRSRFRLIRGEDAITTYTFNTGVARHTFCNHCGVKPFYVPRSNPDGYSVNVRCLDRSQARSLTVEPFDGMNWEQGAEALKRLSEDG